MKQWIRWWGLGLFVVLVLAFWLGLNPLIHWSIEAAGTKAAGAKVELADADLDFGPVTLTLEGLQVTNRKAPMRNLMEARRIEMGLDGYALLRRRFVAENMAVEGLRFDTERKHSGAIEKRKKPAKKKGGFDLGKILPGAELPDPDAIVADERERLTAKIEELNQQAKSIQQQWDERIDKLPGDKAVAQYRERWNELKEKNPLQRAAGVRNLKEDIDEDLDRIRELDDRLKQDRQRLRDLTAQAKALPGKEAERLMAATGLDEGFRGVTRQLLGEKVDNWVGYGLTGYRLAAKQLAGGKADKKQKPPRGEGEYIRFPEKEPVPRFLIKRAALDGAVSTLDFSGTLKDVTTEPAVWGKPMTLKVEGASEAGASLDGSGTFDHRKEPYRDHLEIRVAKLDLTDAKLTDSDQLTVILKQGQADIDGSLTVSGGELEARVKTRIGNAEIAVDSDSDSSTVQRLADALENVTAFNLDLGLSGTLSAPKITLNSDLDRVIGKAVGEEVRAKVAEARKELEQKLRAELAPRIESLAGREEALAKYRERIEQRRQALKKIGP